MNCIFDTSKETANVRGCEATNCEMCLYIIMYYPNGTLPLQYYFISISFYIFPE